MEAATITRVSAVKSKNVTWLIPGMVPAACITIIDGDPGQGKSFLTLEFAARLSRGQAITCNGHDGQPTQAPQSVLIMNAEDLQAETLRPRLEGLGADLDRIHFLEGPKERGGGASAILFPQCWPAIEFGLERTGAKLLIVDPVMAFLDPHVKSFFGSRCSLGTQAIAAPGTTIPLHRAARAPP
jgi:RecA-family ATPase